MDAACIVCLPDHGLTRWCGVGGDGEPLAWDVAPVANHSRSETPTVIDRWSYTIPVLAGGVTAAYVSTTQVCELIFLGSFLLGNSRSGLLGIQCATEVVDLSVYSLPYCSEDRDRLVYMETAVII